MNDTISRMAAIEALSHMCSEDEDGITVSRANVDSMLKTLPPAQPTLYGYKIEHLAYIARVMQKEGVTAEYAVRTFDDMSRALRMIIEEAQERVEKSFSEMPCDAADLIKGTWDAKEVQTTQPDKIEVHLQEPHALMIKEHIVKETTYSMATKQETVGELIRCKDCKNSEHWYRDRRRCFLWSEDGVSVFDDGFCSYAERRTDDQQRNIL